MNTIDLITKSEDDDKYLPINSSYEKRVGRIQTDILDIAEGMDPWKLEFARRYAGGEAKTKIAKDIHRADTTVNKFLATAPAQLLVQYYKLLLDVESGPTESVRKNILYEIALDNQKLDPKESTKAIAELNKMDNDKNKGGGLGTINITISADLPKGPLDA
tara:strand:+ start:35806 stop:36288 length:483 start_codon:yes stop_codon:yes gene_type:complete